MKQPKGPLEPRSEATIHALIATHSPTNLAPICDNRDLEQEHGMHLRTVPKHIAAFQKRSYV